MMLHTLAQDSPMAILVAFPPTCHACTACSKQAEPCQRGDRGPWGCKCRAPGSGRQPPSRRDGLGSRTRRARGSFGRGKRIAGGTRACARGCLCLTPGSPQHPTVTHPPTGAELAVQSPRRACAPACACARVCVASGRGGGCGGAGKHPHARSIAQP